MDSPDCLLILLSISVFLYILDFSVFHLLVVGSMWQIKLTHVSFLAPVKIPSLIVLYRIVFQASLHASQMHFAHSKMVCVFGTPLSPAEWIKQIEMLLGGRLVCSEEPYRRGSRWHHLPKTVIHCGDVALCQLTLTTSYQLQLVMLIAACLC